MYYISKGLKNKKWLAYAFAGFGALAAFGIGNMVQSNSVAEALNYSFGIPKIATGIILAVLAATVILGGIKRIGVVTERLVPFMAAFYILGALFIVISNIAHAGEALGLIFSSAFSPSAAVGGFAGSTVAMAMRRGVSRGVFSNEAGLGSAPIAHAAATTDHPVRQGLWGIFEVFMDTIVICTLTALSIMMSGVWSSGATGGLVQLWDLSDTLNGLMAVPNLIGLLLLSPIVIRRTKEFFNKEYQEVKEQAV